jgi:hypothetical protein
MERTRRRSRNEGRMTISMVEREERDRMPKMKFVIFDMEAGKGKMK